MLLRTSLVLLTLLLLPVRLVAASAPVSPNPGLRYYYDLPRSQPSPPLQTDICVYGGTPGGVAAAIQARRMGKRAVLVVFRRHVGGMTSGGLTAVD